MAFNYPGKLSEYLEGVKPFKSNVDGVGFIDILGLPLIEYSLCNLDCSLAPGIVEGVEPSHLVRFDPSAANLFFNPIIYVLL
jgi:hypothetical protein